MRRQSLALFCCLIGATYLSPASAQLPRTAPFGERAAAYGGPQLVQYGQCSQRVGPFATQMTAWQRWREAQAGGYSVSQGVVPCYWGDTRGYCFNVFRAC